MSKSVLYVLYQKNFFSEGMRGRVSHAKGFTEGLLANKNSVTVLSGPSAEKYIQFDNNSDARYVKIENFFYLKILLFIIKNKGDFDLVVCRWKPFYALLFCVVGLFSKVDIVFEVNSITSLNWKGRLKRLLARIDLKLLIEQHKLILVSESLIQQICCSLGLRKHEANFVVMPNGYDENVFKTIDVQYSKESEFNLIYFGTKQDYYDWDLLYSGIETFTNFGCLNLFGFSEPDRGQRVRSFGRYLAPELREKLSLIKNPILILHSKDCDIARNGSPMKMYEYIALGLPVIMSSVLYDKLDYLKGVVPYDAGEDASLLTAYRYVITNYETLLAEAKISSHAASRRFSWKAVTKKV